jgi:hypothetical protein
MSSGQPAGQGGVVGSSPRRCGTGEVAEAGFSGSIPDSGGGSGGPRQRPRVPAARRGEGGGEVHGKAAKAAFSILRL